MEYIVAKASSLVIKILANKFVLSLEKIMIMIMIKQSLRELKSCMHQLVILLM